MKKIGLELVEAYNNDNVSEIAAQLTYYLVLSIFPFLIALLNIIRFTPLADMNVLEKILITLPQETSELLTNLIQDIVSSSRTTLFSLSIIAALYSASKGLGSLIKAVNRAYDLEETRSFIKIKLISLAMTLGLILLIVITFGVSFFGDLLFEQVLSSWLPQSKMIFKIIQFSLVISSLIIIFTLLYRISPSSKNIITLKESVPGAVFSTVCALVASVGFSFYVNNFGNYSRVYGSLGAVIVLLIWLYLFSIIIIMGAEFNSILLANKN